MGAKDYPNAVWPEQAKDGREQSLTPAKLQKKKKVPTPERSGSEDGSWEQTGPSTIKEFDEEVTPSPITRKIFTRLQERRLLTPGGGASGISGLADQSKAGKATKKHQTT